MGIRAKVGRNDLCPCGTGKKYKHCCDGKVDWNKIIRTGGDWSPHLSIRGRNLHFVNQVSEILEFDTGGISSLSDYKKQFTTANVRKIHEALLEAWPPETDIFSVLEAVDADVSGLYIGDYAPEYITRGIVRHSIYANKILIVDPFVYPKSVRNEFNPIIDPAQYRAQTLKNVNFWFALSPWIEAGIIEVIRTPADFDPELNWDSMKRQKKKFDEIEELKEAAKITVDEMQERHFKNMSYEHLLLSAPDSHLEKTIKDAGLEKDGFTAQDFLKYIHAKREEDPNFLEPMGTSPGSGQLHTMSTGASYDIAQLTARLTGSYLVTDLHVRWREIELDRQSHNADNRVWSPFAKAVQDCPLRYLNQLQLGHALKLRNEGRLESLRGFLHRVWKRARTDDEFDEANAVLLAEELKSEIADADTEWRQIDQDLLKIVGTELVAGLMAAGPLIASGHGNFLAAAGIAAGTANVATSTFRRKRFPDRFPAAFFMNIEDEG